MQTEEHTKGKKGHLEPGEYVMGTVTKVFPYGAFVKLNDYSGQDGMIHISEISAKWVKNIREYVKEGQTVVVKVLKTDSAKGHIDLSLKSVKAVQKKQVTDEHKRSQKARKLLETVGEQLKDKEGVGEIADKLEDKFGDLYSSLENIKKAGENAISDLGLSEKWAKALTKMVEERIEMPKVRINATMELSSNAPDGAEIIKDALVSAQEKYNKDDVKLDIKYISAPKYKIELTASDYKLVEKCLEDFSNEVIGKVSANQGEGKLIRG
jgi:translation initiation factor 2 subunit 1